MASNSQFAVAVHILALLARNPDGRLKSEHIASSVNTNPVVIRRLLRDLSDAGLVSSQKGAAGGSRIAGAPTSISLNDIYEAVAHGEVFSLHPRKPDQDCPVGKNIESVLCNLQKEIDRAINKKLGSYTLADVLKFVERGQEIPV